MTSLVRTFVCAVVLVAAFATHAMAGELWLYYPTNLLPEENVKKLEKLWTRAAAAGYTHVLLHDSKFSLLPRLAKDGQIGRYAEHVNQVKAIAARLKLKVVPAVFQVGYANDLLALDPDLAEGLPADTPMVVRDGVALVEPDPAIRLATPVFIDPTVKLAGNQAVVENNNGNARFCFDVPVQPHRCYHIAVSIQTDDYATKPKVVVLAGNRQLQYQFLAVAPTQPAKTYDVVFNSLDLNKVRIYFGVWSPAKGRLQWRDWRIEDVALVNVLRRPGTPLTVRGDDGRVLREGVDFDPVADPKLGDVAVTGEYDVWHEPPALKTKLPDGTHLRVSWYHPAIIYGGQVCACIAEPKMDELLADQARRMKALWGDGAAGWMMSHDEFRTLGWCKACVDSHKTPGQLLADNLQKCTALLAPAQTYVWSDMVDPTHNAVPGPYFLVNGPWTDAWHGLSKDTVVMNWNFNRRDESLKFFAGRGNRQIVAAYYDDPSLAQTRQWIASAASDPSVIGYMYTTWENRYAELEAFADLVHHAQAAPSK